MATQNRQERVATLARQVALAVSFSAAVTACLIFVQIDAANGIDAFDIVRSLLILVSTWWLAWGASLALLGLVGGPVEPQHSDARTQGRTVVLVPVYNEEPVTTFSRIAAMEKSLSACGPDGKAVHFAILSDTRNEDIAKLERVWFLRLLRECDGEGKIFYRRRSDNSGRKAGNIEDFFKRSGGAYDYALILDADSLMEGETILEMVRRMDADPTLGLLQSLPKVIRARTIFGRAMQFAASFNSPVFARGLGLMQGRTGPFWGHNAMVRVRAFVESCGLPELSGRPPFGGHIMSHDYVEAALLARAGWQVRLDVDLEGSYEEGPENILDHAKRDRRWCQGNLQHTRLLLAPGLKPWSRFVFVQGIFAYIAPLFWLGFLAASITAPAFTPPPDYFPVEDWRFPIFPSYETSTAIALLVGIIGLLILPKLLVAVDAILRGRADGFGCWRQTLRSTLAELLLSSVTAPVLLVFQTRSVLQVLRGSDGGWPTNNRGDGSLTYATGWAASYWIVSFGLAGLGAAYFMAPSLVPWLLPVTLPMILAPVLIVWSSRPLATSLFLTPAEKSPSPILKTQTDILEAWRQTEDSLSSLLGTDELPLAANRNPA
ncbi:glucans biosynthesis glucosyltransferase MdoH [Pseudoruegeria sp. SK021]|uniref:glucans biosynthesis glucosyltransferase MdoH n=1 Tax=Pseudoruegeria sp. SK021 TaxID=1933035 RepID=UPI000A222CBE|nr:glucans biosynthesis glucosyltransferase MdoH [Pseudoruegeria sp. SK021]OSP55946.1 glucan biosynthesis glucosyltransferase H [Pseudoruegeria sp. SK021]